MDNDLREGSGRIRPARLSISWNSAHFICVATRALAMRATLRAAGGFAIARGPLLLALRAVRASVRMAIKIPDSYLAGRRVSAQSTDLMPRRLPTCSKRPAIGERPYTPVSIESEHGYVTRKPVQFVATVCQKLATLRWRHRIRAKGCAPGRWALTEEFAKSGRRTTQTPEPCACA
jgi:hypothetical protein